MKKVRGAKSNKFHDELGGAIAGLAHSAKIAVNRAALRTNATMMSDAELRSAYRRFPYRRPQSGKPHA